MSDRKLLPGKFVWFEHESRDPKRAQGFYGELFGWRMQPSPMGSYTYEMIYAGDEMTGGYAKLDKPDAPARWMACVSVEDVDAAARAAAANGGRVVDAPMPIPGVGRIARIADPQGAELHVFRSDAGDPPDTHRATPGRWAWNELHTNDAAAALAFYDKVVGFASKAMDMGPGGVYQVISSKDGAGRGGVSTELRPGVAPHWLPYVFVADADATASRARMLGATVVMPPTDIPTVGRIAVFTDPTGAKLAILEPAPGM
ncbi:MAG TPA: VOC family protein [Polyangia bacterium]